MSEVLTIPKIRELPDISNYGWLRKKAMEYIRALSGKLWTDHNIHDPGITILEVLCYALTEGGYKNNFPIKDLVSRLPGETKKDFYTARQILTCNPTTILDFKKYIIDQDGIQNAWLYKLNYKLKIDNTIACTDLSNFQNITTEPLVDQAAFYYQCNNTDSGYQIKLEADPNFCPKYLNGLYNINLMLEEDAEFGDLNANTIEWQMTTALLRIVFPVVELQFPSWDYPLANITEYNNISNATVTVNGTGSIRNIDLQLEFDGDTAKTISFGNLKLVLEDTDGSGTFPINSAIKNALQQLYVTSLSFPNLVFKRYKKIVALIKEVYCALQKVRNLCEDYVKFTIVRQQEILLCADVEVEPDVDLEEVLAKIYFLIDNFLSPPVHFYNLLELYEKGKTTEEIFEGPPLNHGFIDADELAKSELRSEVHTSDLYNIIMSIPGVTAVTHLQISNYLDGVAMTDGELWCLQLGAPYALNLSKRSNNKIHFYKEGLEFFADEDQVELLIKTLKAENSKPKLLNAQNDLAVPEGTYRNLADYYSIQNDFPDVYKAGKNGIASYDTQLRIAQTKQLKGFLLFFDQLLANFFAQLNMAKDLLTLDNSISLNSTYATVPVYDTNATTANPNYFHVQNLFKPFTEQISSSTNYDNESSYAGEWQIFANDPYNDFLKLLQAAVENIDTYYHRRNYFLDHLIARFAESFGDYANITRKITIFSAEEAGFTITTVGGLFGYQLLIGGVNLLESNPKYPSDEICRNAIVQVIQYGVRPNNYQIDAVNPFNLRLLKNGSEIIGVNNNGFINKLNAEAAVIAIINHLKLFNEEEIIVDDKKRFLDDYVLLSSQRGKAFQYECCQENINPGGWPENNISGLQRRGSRLLGIDDPTDRPLVVFGDSVNSLNTGFNILPAGGSLFKFEFVIDGVMYLQNPLSSYATTDDCRAVIFEVIERGNEQKNYFIDDADSFKVYLQRKDGTTLAKHVAASANHDDAEAIIDAIITALKKIYYAEGFHLIEHILLRPVIDGPVTELDVDEGYFPICKEDEDCDCPITDYYSFRVTVVFPYWPDRFRNMNFRAFAEKILRYEAPAHVLLKICWINARDMFEFETLYSNWVQLMCDDLPDRNTLDIAIADLIKKINNLTNIYPEGVLHDCTQPTDEPAIVLNQSALGTFDDEESKEEIDG